MSTLKKFTTTFEPEFLEKLKKQAQREDISVGKFIKRMFYFYVANKAKVKRMNTKTYDEDLL